MIVAISIFAGLTLVSVLCVVLLMLNRRYGTLPEKKPTEDGLVHLWHTVAGVFLLSAMEVLFEITSVLFAFITFVLVIIFLIMINGGFNE